MRKLTKITLNVLKAHKVTVMKNRNENISVTVVTETESVPCWSIYLFIYFFVQSCALVFLMRSTTMAWQWITTADFRDSQRLLSTTCNRNVEFKL